MAGAGGGVARDVEALDGVRSIVLKPSESLDESRFTRIAGADFNDPGLGLEGLLGSFASTGFQASNLGDAIDVVNQMLDWRLSHDKPGEDCDETELDPKYRESVKCKIFLGFTSNLVSSGIRDIIRFLAQHRMVDVIVTTAGGIEEDLIKCLAPTYRGDFSLPGALLRSKGLNRIGNLLVPNDNYCKFENWIMPLFDQMLLEQSTENVWTPSKVIARLGKEINDESSYLYWAYKNNIPVYCPSLTDGSLGDMLFCHTVRNPGLIIDIVQDIRLMNGEAIHATPRKTGIIVLGGGLPKHHICNANMFRNGADYAVYINTAQEFDGSDSGAQPDEAVSWGKIKGSAKPVKVHCDVSIAFPLLVAATFARKHESWMRIEDGRSECLGGDSQLQEVPPQDLKDVIFMEIVVSLTKTTGARMIECAHVAMYFKKPLNYEPPFFQCFDDIRKVSYLPQQTGLRDVSQGPGKNKMKALLAGDAKPEPSKMLPLKEPPGETQKGNLKLTEIGDVRTDNVILLDVLYCPEISVNIISEGKLDRDGYSCTRFKHKCKIQYRKTKAIVGIADEDKEFVYRVNHCRCDLSSKRPREDDSEDSSLKRSRKDQ
ncbi:hypothetical protein C2845_PM01G28730 [Panicum miliaceum]|uniref:Deoxyhypusine synthase n=1 Tax=Panicum miliaceum TaxID=4540 RepID=A0A3L6THZ7_PANMI|nr:hypothetical protein C2845_PM01G28730 [Panicum miliaceum]